MEWIFVRYPRVRDVFIDGRRSGRTNRLLIVREGTQAVDLGSPVDYLPPAQTVTVTDTSPTSPMTIGFEPSA